MRDLDDINLSKSLKNDVTYFNEKYNQSHAENVNIILVIKKRLRIRKKHNVFIQAQQQRIISRLSRYSRSKDPVSVTRHSSMPELNECTWPTPPRNRSGRGRDTIQKKYQQSPFRSKFIVNVVSEHRFGERLNPFRYPRQTKLKIYRCEVGGTEDNCCCSCNSDAMFEIMRSLYECYKKRDCTNCTCILCSHLKPEDKLSEKEKHLRDQAMKGLPLPEGKTSSEKKLINKVRTDLGVPIEPKTKEIRDKHEEASKAGKLLPLEGKTPEEKEKILQELFDMGIPLPKGRTPSEKALITKISGKEPSDVVSVALAPSEQMRRAKAEGLLTPLKGKNPEEREKILKGLAMIGLPLPEGQTPSENKLIDKVRTDLGLPVEPENKDIRDKHEKAAKAGKLKPLEGKTPEQKEKILKGLHNMGIPLPLGRTPSEKSLIAKIAASPRESSKASSVALAPSEQMRRAKAEGLLTSLKGKTPKQREEILRGLAMKGLPLPEAQSPSEKKLIKKVRTDLGVPIEPKTKDIRKKHEEAAKLGKLLPLEGKKPAKKKKILQDLHNMGIPLPVGRTPSEKALIAEVKAKKPTEAGSVAPAHSELMRKAKEEGLLTPLKGKTPEQKEKIVKGLAMKGLSLPEAQSPSEKKLIDKVRADLGLPKDPTTKSMKDKHEKAAKAGLLQPLEGKTPKQKEKTLKGLRDLGIPLPEGRTPSEKALIEKVKASPPSIIAPSEQLRRAKVEGLLTPLKGKSPEQKEKIVKGLAMKGLPLPEAESPSEKKLIDKVRAELGLPKDPTTKSMKDRHEQAAKAGLLQPLEGKTPAEKAKVLKGLRDLGIPLPEGRTPSEKALIDKVKTSPRSVIAPSEQLRRAKAEGLLTPLKGKPPEQKEKILKGLAMKGLPLPEAQSPSEKKLIDKVRTDLGLPKDPTTKSMKDKHEQAAKAGLLQPLEGKTPAEKAKVLKGLRDMGIPLPEGRTPSEKALIGKIKESPRSVIALSEQLRRAKAEGLLTALKGKPPEQREKILKGLAMKGLPLPEAQSPSEKKLIDKVRADLGLPKDPTTKSMKDKHEQAAKAGLLQPLEGKTPAEKAKVLKRLRDLGIPLPEGRTPSEKALIDKVKTSPRSVIAPSEQLRRAKAEGLLTPLKGKPSEQKEKILKGLAMKGLPLPEAQSPSEKKLIDKVRADLGLPKDPTTKSMKDKHEQAAKAGLLQPLEGKTPAEKAKVLKGLRDLGIPLPEGRTPSEKALIGKIKESPRSAIALSEQLRRAKAEGLLTALKGKPPEQREKILKGLAMKGLPLPEAQSPSEKKLIDKVRADLGLPKDPTTKSMKDKHEQAAKAGLLQPLEGKTPAEKAKVLKGLRDLGIPLPEGRTPSEKALIGKVKEAPRSVIAPSEQLRRAKVEGLLTTLKGKPPEQKEKIVKGLAMKGLPLPEAQSPSEKKLIDKVRADLGLPKDPTTKSMKERHEKAAKAGLLQPLEGKTPAEKAKVLKGLRDLGIPLPEGRTPSEKALIDKVKASPRSVIAPSEQLRRAKAEGLLTPLKGKPPEQKEKILKGLAMKGLPLPEAQSPSEKKLIDKVRADLGLPKDPTTKSMKDRHEQAAKAGLLQPLEGKTPAEKAKLLKGLRDLGIPLPEGRTPSEKALIGKVKEASRSVIAPSEQLRRAKAEGLLTPLKGKPPEQKEKILKGLAMKGLPLPEAQSPSEKKLIDKVRADLGLPKDPTTKSMKDKHEQAAKAGLLQPLEGKTPAEKAKVLKGLRDLGIPLPEGRTPSEKALIAKVKASSRSILALSEQLRRAKAEGLLTPLKGKTPDEREKILKGLALKGLPLPEGQTPSENKLINKVRTDLGLPIEPKTKDIRDKHEKAAKAGKLLPLEGKTPAQKEKILKGLHNMGIPLPIGRTPSEKSLIAKIAASPRGPSKAASPALSFSEQLRAANAEGLLTPLENKTPEEREKILKGLAMKGLPLPEGQTPSENKLIEKVRTDLGLPIEPKTKDIRDKHKQAAKARKLLPLEGKTPEQKKKILNGLHEMGIPLPIGRTPSEKSLIAKIAASPRGPSKAASPALSFSEQLRAANAEGLLTPLENKTPEEREKILKGLAMKGLPLPEGQSPSENKLIEKVRTDLGLPIEPKTKDIRDKHKQAAKARKLLPLEGKTPEQKEKILNDLHEMGIPLPIGRTPSEKALIAKVMAGPAAAIDVSASKKAAGISEEYEEIQKTTKCDRGCGCDKKKIRFKHSYVKIRVTSPDISSFCDCPDICIPGVKSGVFIDSEGIKVTVASVLGIPSFTAGYNTHKTFDEFSSKKNYSDSHTENKGPKKSLRSKYKLPSYVSSLSSNIVNNIQSSSSYFESSSTRPNSTESERIYLHCSTPLLPTKLERTVKNYQNQTSKTKSTGSSLSSILVLKSEMSLCSTISNKIMNTVSLTSVMNSSITSTSTHYSSYQSTDDTRSTSSVDELSTSDDLIGHSSNIEERKKLWNIGATVPKYTIMRVSRTRFDFRNNGVRTNVLNSEEDPIVLLNRLPTKLDVSKIMNKIMSKKRFADASSIFIVVPMSEDEEEQASSDCIDSITSINLSETETIWKDTSQVDPNLTLRPHSFTKGDDQICKKGKKFYLEEISSCDTGTMSQNDSVQAQISRPIRTAEMKEKTVHTSGTDTNTSIPCCCCPKEYPKPFAVQSCTSNEHYTANDISQRKKSRSMQEFKAVSKSCKLDPATSEVNYSSSSAQQIKEELNITYSDEGETCGCSYSPASTESARLLSDIPSCPDSHMSLHDSLRIPARLGHNMHHSRIKTTTPQKNLREVQSHTVKPTLSGSSNKLKTTHNTTHNHTDEVKYPIVFENQIRRNPIKRCASQQSYMSINSSDEDCCLCEDIEGTEIMPGEIIIRKRIQESRKTKLPIDSTHEEDYVCEITEHTRIIPDKISNRNPCILVSPKSGMLADSSDEEYCICVDTESSDKISNQIAQSKYQPRPQASETSKMPMDTADGYIEDINESPTRQPRFQRNRKSKKLKDSAIIDDFENIGTTEYKMDKQSRPQTNSKFKIPIYPTNEEYCLCNDSEGTDIIPVNISHHKSKILINSADRENLLCEEIEDTDNMLSQEFQLQANGNTKMSINPTNGNHCLCDDIEVPKLITDAISNNRPRPQASRKFGIPKYFTDVENCLCEDIEGIETITAKISSLNEEYCICQEIEGTDIRTDRTSNRKPRLQENRNSKMSIYSSDAGDLDSHLHQTHNSEEIEGTDKMPINPTEGDHYLREDIEGINERSIQQPHFKATQKSKKPKESAVEEDFEIIDVVDPSIKLDELRNRQSPGEVNRKSIKLKNSITKEDYEIQQQSNNLTIKDYECQQQSKDYGTKVNGEAQRQSEDFTIKANCEYQQNALSTVQENSDSYQQQSKVFSSNGFSACEEIAERNGLCITGQSHQPDRASTNSTKLTKWIINIRKSISHKIKQTWKNKRKKYLKAEKKSELLQSNHSIQTMPEQILYYQQIPPNATSEPDYGYPYENSFGRINIEELMRLRSELTEITSGFKACKKRNQRVRSVETWEKPNAEIELDFEDAIKYYVGKNLEQFRDLILPIQSLQKTKQEENKKVHKMKHSSQDSEEYNNIDNFFTSKDCCECPYGPVPLEISYKSITFTPVDSSELSNRFPKGLKFSLGGTGLQPSIDGLVPRAARKPDHPGAGA